MSGYSFIRYSVAVIALSFVVACGGGGSEVTNSSTTTGQELLDLQKAKDSGVITQDEYNDQREKILDKN